MDTFDPVSIGFGHKRAVLTDAMVACANPAKELLREAQDLLGKDAEVSTIVSIGAGKRNFSVVFKDGREAGISEGLRRGIAMCEQVHEDLQGRLEETKIYYRFNVEQELGIDPEVVLAYVSAYLREKAISTRIDKAVKSIQILPTGVRLKDISEYYLRSSLFLTVRRFGDGDWNCAQATAVASRQFRRSGGRPGGDASDPPHSSTEKFQEIGDQHFIRTGRCGKNSDGAEVCVGFRREVRRVMHISIKR
jgi:hypothetical protein